MYLKITSIALINWFHTHALFVLLYLDAKSFRSLSLSLTKASLASLQNKKKMFSTGSWQLVSSLLETRNSIIENCWKMVYRPAIFSSYACLVWNASSFNTEYYFLPGTFRFRLRNLCYFTNTVVGRFLKCVLVAWGNLSLPFSREYKCTYAICLWRFVISSIWDTESSSNF